MRPVTHILDGKDEKAKAIREILDLFLPTFRNLSNDTPILIDLPKNLNPSVSGTGVSVLTNLYFEIEINPKIYIDEDDNEYIFKQPIRDFERCLRSSINKRSVWFKRMSKYKLELEKVNKFTDIAPEVFMACVVLEIYKRSGLLDFDLFSKAPAYYSYCIEVVELLQKNLNINNSVIPNPAFNCIEHIVFGDGDFILDGNLFDIKTNKSIAVDKKSRRQLLFYYLLNHRKSYLYKKGYETEYDISKLYIYKARYGVSIEIPINLRGANPLKVINTISKVEAGNISPSRGVEIVKSMLKEDL